MQQGSDRLVQVHAFDGVFLGDYALNFHAEDWVRYQRG